MRAIQSALKEAWNTISPPVGDKHRTLSPLFVLLTVVTGLVDAFSYLALGHVFVANMTGNVVFLAFSLSATSGFSILPSVIALIGFSLGALLGGRIVNAHSSASTRLFWKISLLQSAFISCTLVIYLLSLPFLGVVLENRAPFILIVLMSIAMGLQNAAARKFAVPDLTTTVLTLTVTGISADSKAAGGTGSRLGRRLVSIGAMFAGAVLGTLLIVHDKRYVVLIFALLLTSIVTTVSFKTRETDE